MSYKKKIKQLESHVAEEKSKLESEIKGVQEKLDLTENVLQKEKAEKSKVEQKVKQVSTLFSHKFRNLYSSTFSSPVQMRDSKHVEHASWIILRPLNSGDPGVTVNDEIIM